MYCSFNKMYFDSDLRRICDDWSDKKSLTSKILTMGPDWERLELDVFFLMAAYFITSSGGQFAYDGTNQNAKHFLHPDLASLKHPASSANKLSDILKVYSFFEYLFNNKYIFIYLFT